MQKNVITTHDLVVQLDHYLNSNAFQDNAINGLQVANVGHVDRVATAVSASVEAIEQAINMGSQVLIVHHGVFKKNDIPDALVGIKYHKIALLMKHNIALLCYHLPLDAHRELGNNWKAAYDLGLRDCMPFMELHGQYIGVIGSLPSIPFEEFKIRTENYYGRQADAVEVKKIIAKVAIVSGKADRCIVQAAKAGADCFITGTHDEPTWDHAQEENISFLSFGHYTTEMVGPKALATYIQNSLGIETQFIKTNNPF